MRFIQHHAMRKVACLSVLVFGVLVVAPSAANAQTVDTFCAKAANVRQVNQTLGAMQPKDVAAARALLQTVETELAGLRDAVPPQIAGDVLVITDAFTTFSNAIQAINPSAPNNEQLAQLKTALTAIVGKAGEIKKASSSVEAFITANCDLGPVPVGGVDTGAGGTAGGTDGGTGPLTVIAVAGLAAAGLLVFATRRLVHTTR